MSIVLVTGASRGIGLALCRHLARRGDQIIAVCRRPSAELTREAADRARRASSSGGDPSDSGGDAGAGSLAIEADVELTSDDAVSALARRLDGRRIDTIVLNAGILRADDLESLDLDAVREQIEVNAIAPLRVARALMPCLGSGSKVALITSRMGSLGDNTSGGYFGYRMSKAALNAAGVSLARDLAGRGVAVAILHPGYVRTDMTEGAGNVDAAEAARLLTARIDELTLATSGGFWHANGERLPW